MPEQGLVTVLHSLMRRLSGTPDERQRIWDGKLHPWLCRYWPREQGRNTRKTSETILAMLAECGDGFPQAAEWSLTCLRPVEGQSLHDLNRSDGAKQHPESMLQVLDKAIDADIVSDYNKSVLGELLDALRAGNGGIAGNRRFQELQRIAAQ